MGLDVYLYRIKDRSAFDALVQKEESGDGDFSDAIDAIEESVQCDSKEYPKHYFKVGYWRSSYNDSGINRVVGNLCDGKGLDYIAGAGGDYRVFPDWKEALKRAHEVLETYYSKRRAMMGCRITEASRFLGGPPPKSADEVAAIFMDEAQKAREAEGRPSPFDRDEDGNFVRWYSNRTGDFYFGKPIRVRAVVPGLGVLGQPTTYIVWEPDGEAGADDFYVQALRIVIETLRYVDSQPDPENYYFHWSG